MNANIETIHIAFADDHPLFRQGVISFLRTLGGIEVDVEADNGQQLLDKLQQATVLPQVCIIDINMPAMDGFMVVAEIRKRWPDMKFLILTASGEERYIIRMIIAGINGYLLKSSDGEEIKKALISIHTNGYYYSESASSTLFELIKAKAVKLQHFTPGELEVLKYCCSELSISDIATKLHKTFRSVEGTRDRLYRKLNVKSRVGLVLFAVQMGLKPIEPIIPAKEILYIKNKWP